MGCATPLHLLFALSIAFGLFLLSSNAQDSLERRPTYVTSACYGDSFNLDCGEGHQVHVTRDDHAFSASGRCDGDDVTGVCGASRGVPVVSLAQQLCTGRQTCAHLQVERRPCGGVYSNVQRLQYQCIPGKQAYKYPPPFYGVYYGVLS